MSPKEAPRSGATLWRNVPWNISNLRSSLVLSSRLQKAFSFLIVTRDIGTVTVSSRRVGFGLPQSVSISYGGDMSDGDSHYCITNQQGRGSCS